MKREITTSSPVRLTLELLDDKLQPIGKELIFRGFSAEVREEFNREGRLTGFYLNVFTLREAPVEDR